MHQALLKRGEPRRSNSLASIGNGNCPRCSGRILNFDLDNQLGGAKKLKNEPLASRFCNRFHICFCADGDIAGRVLRCT